MNKLLSILLAGTFATGAALAQSPAKTGVDTGDLAGSNTPSGTGAANVGTNHTTTADSGSITLIAGNLSGDGFPTNQALQTGVGDGIAAHHLR